MNAATRGADALAGLGNQARREAATWWSRPRWWRQSLVWSALLAGLLALVLWVVPAVVEGGAPELALEEAAGQFAELAAMVTAVGVVLLTQGVLIDERRSGVTEWLLSKPLSRPALVLAKFGGHASGLLVACVAVPWAVVLAVLSAAGGALWPVGSVALAAGLVALLVVFHLAFVLALSVWTDHRVVVLAVPLALLVGGDLLVAAAPALADASPYLLGRLAGGVMATGDLAAAGPALAAVGWTAALLAAALWGFARQEA